MTTPTKKKTDRKCRACDKSKRDCILPCRLADSAFTEDERFVQWLAHVYRRLDAESDRLDPERKRPGGAVACLDNAVKNLGTAIFYLSGKHASEIK
jgi:hypothetical protein